MQFDDEKISGLAAALDKVEAPSDFNAKVRARIASAPRTAAAPGFGRILRIVAPAAALVVVGFLIWNLPNRTRGQLGVAMERRPADVAFVGSFDRPSVNESNVATVEEGPRISPRGREEARKKANRASESDGGGSIVSAVREGPTVTPRIQIDPSTTPGFERTRKIRIADVLYELGIDSDTVDGRIAVRAVRANSVAERSGIVAGDMIDAINDRTVSAETTFTRSVEGRTITIVRDGKKIVTPLK